MFTKYQYVHALYTEQSFTRAAEKLFISQPSLSAAIRGVEKQVGVPLFQRTGAGVVPTDAGRVYVDAVEQIIRIENECRRQLDDISSLKTGSLTVGGTNYLSSYVFPRVFSAYTRQYPGVQIANVEANSSRLEDMLKADEVDLVMDSFDEHSDVYQCFPLLREHILLCVPAGWDINRALTAHAIRPDQLHTDTAVLDRVPPVSIRRFAGETFISLKKGNDMHARAVEIFKKGGVAPRIPFRVDQLNIAYAIVALGTGCCFVTDTLFRYGKFTDDVVLYPIAEADQTRALCVAYRKGKYCTHAMQQWIETARQIIR